MASVKIKTSQSKKKINKKDELKKIKNKFNQLNAKYKKLINEHDDIKNKQVR